MDVLHNISNHSYDDFFWFIDDCTHVMDKTSRRIALFLLYLLLFMVGLVENCLVLWVNWKRRPTHNSVLFCVLNVCISDLMVVLVVPFFMLEAMMDKVWVWGSFLCKFTHFVYVINFYSSTFFLAYMTVARYLSLAQPTSPNHGPVVGRWQGLLCAGLWLLAFVLAMIENAHITLLEWDEAGCYLLPEYSYVEWYASITVICLLFQFVGPAAIIITCNVLIARAVVSAPDAQGRRDVWLVHLYSLVFVVCWLPLHLVLFLLMLDELVPHLFKCSTYEVLFFSYSLVQCLSLFHCIANPILYNFLSKSFRGHLISTVARCIPREVKGSLPPANASPAATRAGTNRKEPEISSASTSHSAVGP